MGRHDGGAGGSRSVRRIVVSGAAVALVIALAVWGTRSLRSGWVAGSAVSIGTPRSPVAAAGAAASTSPQTSSSPSPLSPPDVNGPGWRLAFDARFPGDRLDTSVWGTCYPWANPAVGCTNFGNAEREWYLPSQDRVSGGVLHLVAQPIPTWGRSASGAPQRYLCRSGMVTTYPSFRFEYGYVQVVAQIPNGAGLWPALWLAAANLAWPPEIDLLEHWGPPDQRTGTYLHPVGAAEVQAHPATADLSVGWHTFSVNWTPSSVAWFIDGHLALFVEQHVPHQPMYFIANVADYWLPPGGGGCTGSMLIRSVEVWQPAR